MGSRTVPPVLELTLLIPRSNTLRYGDKQEGGLAHVGSCISLRWRKAERYDSMVDTERFCAPRNATNRAKFSWVIGVAGS